MLILYQRTEDKLPDYGMYLKTASSDSFTPESLLLDKTHLIVRYTGGDIGQYIVVHAFKNDSLEDSTTSFAAAKEICHNSNLAIIDVTKWGLLSLNGYTIKVWMESAAGGPSLAPATVPVTFIGGENSISRTKRDKIKNVRVFAMKNDLRTSWGDLSTLSNDEYNNVISGKSQDGTDGYYSNRVHGSNPTNQKIYFGSKDGVPLQFWIAGRETLVNGGEIDSSGSIMTLYQAKSVESSQFNNSAINYNGTNTVTLKLKDRQSTKYTGSESFYPVEKIVAINLIKDYKLNWQYRTQGTEKWNHDMPINPGNYEIRCCTEGTNSYERTYSAVLNFKVIDHSVSSGLNYNGLAKNTTAVPKPGITNTIEPTVFGTSIKNFDSFTNTHSEWGQQEIYAKIPHYIDSHGCTSVEVIGKEIICLKEKSGATNTWCGLDNSAGIFKQGSKFHVNWISKENDISEWEKYYLQMDDEYKALVDEGKLCIFLIGVTDPEGNEYKNFDAIVPFYIQLVKDWDEDDLNAIYIASGKDDEIVGVSIVENMEYPEGTGKFLKLELRHFSPYAIYLKRSMC